MSARIFIEAIGMDQLEDGVSGGARSSLMNPSLGSTFSTRCTRFPAG